MEMKEIVQHAMDDYRRITGLRSYVLYDNTVIQSASERNYFCKCLKVSAKALAECERCTHENYNNAKEIDSESIYSCHAGLIKWAVPVDVDDFHCVVISEGILSVQQVEEDAERWTKYLSEEYNLDQEMLLDSFRVIKTMDEKQMYASIELLKNLLSYHISMRG